MRGGFDTVTITVPEQASAGKRYAVVLGRGIGAGVRRRHPREPRRHPDLPLGRPWRREAAELRNRLAQREALPAGAPLVVAIVHNTGGRTLDISGDLILTQDQAASRRALSGRVESRPGAGRLRVGDRTARQAIPRGPWQAQIRLRQWTRPSNGSRDDHLSRPRRLATAPGSRRVAPTDGRPVIILLVLLAIAALGCSPGVHPGVAAALGRPPQPEPRLNDSEPEAPPGTAYLHRLR